MTMKVLLIGVLSLAACVVPAGASIITLDGPLTVGAGASFDVTVQLTDVFATHPGASLTGFGFDIVIGHPANVTYTGGTVGALFADLSAPFPASPQVAGIPVGGAVFGILDASDFSEPLILAVLHFQALAAGSSTIGITTDPLDSNQGLFYAPAAPTDPIDQLNASSSVDVAAVPEPALGMLGGLVLLGLAAAKVHGDNLSRRDGRR